MSEESNCVRCNKHPKKAGESVCKVCYDSGSGYFDMVGNDLADYFEWPEDEEFEAENFTEKYIQVNNEWPKRVELFREGVLFYVGEMATIRYGHDGVVRKELGSKDRITGIIDPMGIKVEDVEKILNREWDGSYVLFEEGGTFIGGWRQYEAEEFGGESYGHTWDLERGYYVPDKAQKQYEAETKRFKKIARKYGFKAYFMGGAGKKDLPNQVVLEAKNTDGEWNTWFTINLDTGKLRLRGNTDHSNLWFHETRRDMTPRKLVRFVKEINAFITSVKPHILVRHLIDPEDYQEIKGTPDDAYDDERYFMGAESFRVGDEGMFEGGEVRITSIEDNSEDGRQNVYFFTYLDEEGNSDGFTHTSGERKFLNQFSMFPRDWNAEEFGAESNFDALKQLKKRWREDFEHIGITYEEMLEGEINRLRNRMTMKGFDPNAKIGSPKYAEEFGAEEIPAHLAKWKMDYQFTARNGELFDIYNLGDECLKCGFYEYYKRNGIWYCSDCRAKKSGQRNAEEFGAEECTHPFLSGNPEVELGEEDLLYAEVKCGQCGASGSGYAPLEWSEEMYDWNYLNTAEEFGAETDYDDYIQRIFTFIDEKLGNEYFLSIEDEEEVARFKQAFNEEFNENAKAIEEANDWSWDEILGAETFEARYKDDGTIAYTEIEWFGGYSRTGGNNWGAIPLGNFERERYYFIDGKIVMTSPEVKTLKNEYNVKAIRDLRSDDSDMHFQSMATAIQKQRAKQLIMRVFREYDRNTQFRRGAEEFYETKSAESFEATKGMDTYAQPFSELKIKPTKTKVGILLTTIVAGGLWYSKKMKEE